MAGKFWAFEHFGVVPDIVTFGKGLTAGFANCGTVTTPEIAERTRGTMGLPWSGTYPQDPLPCAVALTQLQIVLRDDLVSRAAREGEFVGERLQGIKDRHDCVGDVRGKGLYRMFDIVKDRKTKEPDPEMAERIRYHALEEGLLLIAVKNYVRFCPPLIATRAELDDMAGRLEASIAKAEEGHDIGTNISASSSLAANSLTG